MPNRIVLEDNHGNTVIEPDVPNCPNCGSRMSPMSSEFGEFWGCSKYPICKVVLPRGNPVERDSYDLDDLSWI